MRTVTHREMRNSSGEILRLVAAGETVQVTNHGVLAAVIVPPNEDQLGELVARGQVRPASAPIAGLRSLPRRRSKLGSARLRDDVRGRW